MKKNKLVMAGMTALSLSFILSFIGCTTTIPVSYTEPARLNMSGVKCIAIKSYETKATSFVSQEITGTGKYTVATETEIKEWEQWKVEQQAIRELAGIQATALEVDATDLVGAYQTNAVRADASYSEKLVKTKGVVKEIGESKGRYYARLDTGQDSIDIYFASSEINQLASVEQGQAITIFGTCLGFKSPSMEDTAEILRLLGGGRSVNISGARFPVGSLKDYTGPVDVVLFIDDAETSSQNTEYRSNPVTDKDGKIMMPGYDRTVTVNVNYEIVHTRDLSPIGNGKKSATAKESKGNESQLSDYSVLAAQAINKALGELVGEMIPTQRSLSLTLEKEKSDKQAKKAMGEADKLVKAKEYKAAAEAYGKVYAQYKNFAAGYNQALLTEVADGTEAAVELMEAFVKATGNATAQSALADMQSRIAANQKSAEQLSE
ncbi:MAG: OB-fold putative lipoprotein [Treponema sp.]|jgi:hypothetical protein|nr:OB-fold putative lipoprotein [Treponema sp.]